MQRIGLLDSRKFPLGTTILQGPGWPLPPTLGSAPKTKALAQTEAVDIIRTRLNAGVAQW